MDAGRVLREARLRAGLTQEGVAERAGVAQSAVARVESGRSVPRIDTLDRLLEACGAALAVERRLGMGIERGPIRRRLALAPEDRLVAARRAHVLRLLAGCQLRFVIVGDLAAAVHGAPIHPEGVDISPGPDPMNRARLVRGLERLNTKRRFHVPAPSARGRQRYLTDRGPVTCWWSAKGLPPYEDLVRTSLTVALEPHVLRVASLDDLMRIRLAAGSPSDLAMAELLGAIREEADRPAVRRPR